MSVWLCIGDDLLVTIAAVAAGAGVWVNTSHRLHIAVSAVSAYLGISSATRIAGRAFQELHSGSALRHAHKAMTATTTSLSLISRLVARWRATVSALVVLAVVLAAVTPALASIKGADAQKSHVQIAQEWGIDQSKHSNSMKDDCCDDGACLGFHGSHCHHNGVALTSSTAYAPPMVAAQLLVITDARRATHPTWPSPKPPRA